MWPWPEDPKSPERHYSGTTALLPCLPWCAPERAICFRSGDKRRPGLHSSLQAWLPTRPKGPAEPSPGPRPKADALGKRRVSGAACKVARACVRVDGHAVSRPCRPHGDVPRASAFGSMPWAKASRPFGPRSPGVSHDPWPRGSISTHRRRLATVQNALRHARGHSPSKKLETDASRRTSKAFGETSKASDWILRPSE